MKNPKVSVVIPVYNGEDYIKDAIDSALNQTYENIEVIVIDDGSTDKTHEICKNYGNKIKYYKKENGGVASALNYGIEKMKGEYFSWLSHDDVYYPNKILEQVEFLSKIDNKNVILFSDFDLIDENSTVISSVEFSSLHSIDLLNKYIYPVLVGAVNGCTTLISKEILEKEKFDESLKTSNDYDMWLRIFKKYKSYYLPISLTKYRIHDKQDTKRNPVYRDESLEFWNKAFNSINQEKFNAIGIPLLTVYSEMYKNMKGAGFFELAEKCFYKLKEEYPNNQVAVSVIMPTYNSSKYVEKAIDSILNQTLFNFELIIVDDGSTDNTVEIVEKKAKEDFRITLKINNKNLGVASVLNKGLKLARGEYITRLDSDDIACCDRLLRQYIFLKNNLEYSYCAVNISLIDENDKIINQKVYDTPQAPLKFLLNFTNPIPNATIMYKNSIIKENNLVFENYKVAEDYDFLNKFSTYSNGYFIKEPLYMYRILSDSLYHKNEKYALTKSLEIVKKHYKSIYGRDLPTYYQYLTDFYTMYNEVDEQTLYKIVLLTDDILSDYVDKKGIDSIDYAKCKLYIMKRIEIITSAMEGKKINENECCGLTKIQRLKKFYRANGFFATIKKIIKKIVE